jgi:glutathione S-transferase
MTAITIHGDLRSGNCLKVLWLARDLGLDFAWKDVDIFAGETRTEAFLSLNPAGQVPLIQFADGRTLAQSNAILLHLAEAHGSRLLPADPWERGKMFEWLFWEQYSHEPCIAVARAERLFRGKPKLDPDLEARGRRALGRMEMALLAQDYLTGEAITLADLALVAYTRVAHEGGFDLSQFPNLGHWIGRVESELKLDPVAEAA